MPQNSHLKDLVNSLSTHERQYLSKRSCVFFRDTNPKYMEILNIMYKNPKISDQDIRKKLRGQITANNYAVAKKYLLTFICESLSDYYKQDDEEIAILREVEMLKMLIRKGQFLLCFKLWKGTIQKAMEQELYPSILHLKEIYLQLISHYQIDLKSQEFEKAKDSYQVIKEKYKNFQNLLSIYYEVTIIRKKFYFRLSEENNNYLKDIMNQLLQLNPEDEQSFIYSHYYNLTLGTVHYLQSNYEGAFPILKKNIDAWLNNPYKVKNDNNNYLEALMGFTAVSLITSHYDEALVALESKVNESISGSYNKAYLDFVRYISLNRLFNRTVQYDKVALLLSKMEESLEKHFNILLIEQKRIMMISMGIAYFAIGNYIEAYNKLFFVKSYFYDKNRIDQVSFTYLFILLISYEMGDEVIFKNDYNNTYHFFYSREKPHEFEIEIISVLNRSFGQQNEVRNPILAQLLKGLETASYDPVQIQVFQMFNFPDWIKSKLEGLSYKDYRIRKYKGN